MNHSSASPQEPLARLRPDVKLQRLGPDAFQLRLPGGGGLLRLNGRERALLHFAGRAASIKEVVASFPKRLGPLSRRDAAEFLQRLEQLGFTSPPSHPAEPHQSGANDQPRCSRARLNALFDGLALVFGWGLSRWMLLPLGLLTLLAMNVLIRDGQALTTDLARMHVESHWVELALFIYLRLLLLISLPTALVVGLAVRRGAGWIEGFGLSWWEGIVPLFEADTGESLIWMPPGDRRRVIWAALLTPLAIANGALVAWVVCEDYHGSKELWLLMIPPAVIAFVMRCNPFASSPAYWLLCDAWDDWRLVEQANLEAEHTACLLTHPNPIIRRRRSYALLRTLYRLARNTIVLIGGGWLAVDLLGGVGAILTLLATAWWNRRLIKQWLSPWLLAPPAI